MLFLHYAMQKKTKLQENYLPATQLNDYNI